MGEDQSVGDKIWDRLEECVQYLVGAVPRLRDRRLVSAPLPGREGAVPSGAHSGRNLERFRGIAGHVRESTPLITRISTACTAVTMATRARRAAARSPRDRMMTQRCTKWTSRKLSAGTSAIATRMLGTPRSTTASTTSSSTGPRSQPGASPPGWRPAACTSASTSPVGGCCADRLTCCSEARATWCRWLRPSPMLLRKCGTWISTATTGGHRSGPPNCADVRRALRPVEASDILVTKVMLGVFGCVPAFDTYFKKGFGVSTFSKGSLRLVGEFYRANAAHDRSTAPAHARLHHRAADHSALHPSQGRRHDLLHRRWVSE